MTWQCPALRAFWAGVCDHITQVTGTSHIDNPQTCLLDLMPKPKMKKAGTKLIDLAFALAKRSITINCKSITTPPIQSWKHELYRWARIEDEVLRGIRFKIRQPTQIAEWDTILIGLEPGSDLMPP